MSALTYPARFMSGGDGRILVEFVDFPGSPPMAKTIMRQWNKPWMLSDRISQSGYPVGKRFARRQPRSVVSVWCQCRFGSRRNWRSTWRCATSK
jgi:hypothetical protein